MSTLLFEPARLEHAKSVAELRTATTKDLDMKLGAGPWSHGDAILSSIRERIKLGDPKTLSCKTLFVATQDGEAVGSMALSSSIQNFFRKAYCMEPGSKCVGVFDMNVFPEKQGRGIGKFLLRNAEVVAARLGIRFLRLDAYTLNPISNGFYRSAGFDERARIDLRGCGLVLYEKRVELP